MDMKVELLLSFSFCRKVVLAFDEKSSLVPSVKLSLSTCLAMSCQLGTSEEESSEEESSEEESSEEESSEEETVKEVIVRESLKFVTDLLVVTVIETLIVQSAYVPTLKVFKVMVLLPEIAEVVLEEHEPP